MLKHYSSIDLIIEFFIIGTFWKFVTRYLQTLLTAILKKYIVFLNNYLLYMFLMYTCNVLYIAYVFIFIDFDVIFYVYLNIHMCYICMHAYFIVLQLFWLLENDFNSVNNKCFLSTIKYNLIVWLIDSQQDEKQHRKFKNMNCESFPCFSNVTKNSITIFIRTEYWIEGWQIIIIGDGRLVQQYGIQKHNIKKKVVIIINLSNSVQFEYNLNEKDDTELSGAVSWRKYIVQGRFSRPGSIEVAVGNA